MEQELIDMADMYANVCTAQQEKFSTWQRWGCPWRWEDCQAAWELAREGRQIIYLQSTRRKHHPLSTNLFLYEILANTHGWQLSDAWHWDRQISVRKD